MTPGVPLPDAPPSIADRPAFSADGVVFTVSDLVQRAVSDGREARFDEARPTPGQVEEAFRRARALLTADQLEAWLATWQISSDDFRAWTSDKAAGTSSATRWCALVCSGELDAITNQVATAAAAACELGQPPRDAASFDPAGWTERLVAEATTDAALQARLDARRLDWTRVRTVAVSTPRRGVAEELRQQVLHDGPDLAGRAGARESTNVLDALDPPGLRSALAGARPGELVGPLPAGEAWLLVHVLDRTEPSLEDPESRARAEAAVRDDVVTRVVARHVVA